MLLHAVSRLVLHPHITNIQASWVKMGPQQAGRLLAAGCNDMGGSIMNESITRAAGARVSGWASVWQRTGDLVCLCVVVVWGGRSALLVAMGRGRCCANAAGRRGAMRAFCMHAG